MPARDTLPMRYEIRKLPNGWAVWDTGANAPAIVEDCWQVSLPFEDADDLADLLNRTEREKIAATQH